MVFHRCDNDAVVMQENVILRTGLLVYSEVSCHNCWDVLSNCAVGTHLHIRYGKISNS